MTDLPLLSDLNAMGESLPGAGLGWLADLRRHGLDRYEGLGLPTTKVEEWKYTNLRPLAAAGFSIARAPSGTMSKDVPDLGLADGALRVVLVNGHVDDGLSELTDLPDGLALLPFERAVAQCPEIVERHLGKVARLDRKALVALNTAHLDGGLVLHVAAGTRIERPVHLAFVGQAGSEHLAWQPRLLIVAENDSALTVVETHSGDGAYFSNGVSEAVVGEGAALRHYKIQDEDRRAFHIAAIEASVAARGLYESFILSTGGALSRNQLGVLFAGEDATCRLNGAYLMRGGQHADTTSVIDHAVPHCTSTEVYKGVLDDKARAVFQAKTIVRKDAQKTDARQLNKTLLLSNRAEIDAKPELEIYADDVLCSHGATAGEIDENALFYLRSRGIDAEDARAMLIDAFVDEALLEISEENLRDVFRATVARWRQGSGA